MNKLEMVVLQQVQPRRAVVLRRPDGTVSSIECVGCALQVNDRNWTQGVDDFAYTSVAPIAMAPRTCALCSQQLEFA